MHLARVIGSVVATRKEEELEGLKFLLLEHADKAALRGQRQEVPNPLRGAPRAGARWHAARTGRGPRAYCRGSLGVASG